ncbi:argininosuccinate lyase [Exiguobacterium aurantiacum]|uniref:Argininosuccinate lyase n=1 Tax=Exiguobacterium aurantiacum TaxID=33987 RepID=A0A377FUA2_9BACL|nr:argininosuccinate lyase [Exiguobacterium aurantiacum]STO08035.1 Argininosuccinate lyase [Exiguobacterium aurantiacum]
MSKLWGGRFEQTASEWVDEFGASIHFDKALVLEDIEGSIAHVTMLGEQHILAPAEVDQIVGGLHTLAEKAKQDGLTFNVFHEDIHMNLEALLHEEIGPVAGKMHTARSRNDQVATDMHLYLKRRVVETIEGIESVQQALVSHASQNVETVMPGYTHLQRAQPVSLAHHLLAYFWMLERDKERFHGSLKRIDMSPLGAGALAGTTFPIDRHRSAELLGFSRVYPNSLDAVSDRDFILEYLSNASLLMMHLSRFCEELILWSSEEFKFITISDVFSTGSSMMPQKKNPDMAELVRGKSGRVVGNLIGLLTIMKGLPLAYNKDLQEDKEGMFDTVKTVQGSLSIMAGMIQDMTFHADTMKRATERDFSNATELADYLSAKGMPFREAHEVTGTLVRHCIEERLYLSELPLETYQAHSALITEDLYDPLSPVTAVARRNSYGGTGFDAVRVQLEEAKQKLPTHA